MSDIKRYLDGVESQHKSKPRFTAFLTSLLQKVDAGTEIINAIPAQFDVNTATGAQLDAVGEFVGVPRTISQSAQDDEAYRKVILSKIIQNRWDGSGGGFHEIFSSIIGGISGTRYRDNMDMSVGVYIPGQIGSNVYDLVQSGYILPKPMGVRLDITMDLEKRAKFYQGTALYKSVRHSISVSAEDPDDYSYLTDETETILTDESSVVLFT